jgi:hypothetical protein
MQGLGFFIWQLETINDFYTPEALAQLLKQVGVRWVSWKLAEGIYPWNQVKGNDKQLIEYMQALEAVGIASGGWIYAYPEKPGSQAGLIAERIAKFSNNLARFDHWMVDVEGEWKKQNLGGSIDNLLYLDVNKNFQVGFCSYRFPALHQPLNFGRFLKNETIKFNAPQVYWLGDHNVVEQLDFSFDQYAKITDKPFVPIGSAWGQVVGDVYWEPTAEDLQNFVKHCIEREWYTYGFWSLDWIVKKQRMDILEAISGAKIKPPVVPPGASTRVVVTVNGANPRTRPVVASDTDGGSLTRGKIFEKVGKNGEWYKIAAYVHESVVDEV